MRICILDPGIEDNNGSKSINLGDLIIQESVSREIMSLFGACNITRVSTHVRMKREQSESVRGANYSFVGGSNLLGNGVWNRRRLKWWRQWNVSMRDAGRIHNVILLGVGWRVHEGKTGFYTRSILRAILARDALHSVRDDYTKGKLWAIGIRNVINTGCPSMWCLTPDHCNCIPTEKQENVLCTFTCYRKDHHRDRQLFETIRANYRGIFFWPQQCEDRRYAEEIFAGDDVKCVEYIDSSVDSLDAFLSSKKDVEYVGTRLHCAIRAMQHGRRAITIGVDNRAIEISKDVGLIVTKREDLHILSAVIRSTFRTSLSIPYDRIDKWKQQFTGRAVNE